MAIRCFRFWPSTKLATGKFSAPACVMTSACEGSASRPATTVVIACTRSSTRAPTQRHDREHEAVEVVVDVEVGGEAGSGELNLVPPAVRALRVHEPGDPAVHGLRTLAGGIECQQGPGGLRG